MSNLFCPLPWISTSIRNDGKLRVCCHANQGPNKGELNWDVDDIKGSRNSPALKKIRKQILDNEWPEDCIRCKKESESGIRTRFQYESEIWKGTITKDKAKLHTTTDGEIDTSVFPLIYYDLRFGNLCNLQCRYCSPYSSSSWGKVPGDYQWFERESLWEHLKTNINNIQLFHIEGGEPLLINKQYDFMEFCIKLDRAKNIKIEYTSSLNIVPEKAWDLWKHFKEVRIGISVDGINDVFDYIRYPSKFNEIEQTMHRIDQAPGNFVLWIACTINTLSIWYLPEFFKWKIKQNFQRINNNTFRPYCSDHPIHKPEIFNIKSLPKHIKLKVEKHLNDSIVEVNKVINNSDIDLDMKEAYKNSTKNLFDSYITYMNSEDLSIAFKSFFKFNDKLDQQRQQTFESYLPEWNKILKE